MLNLASITLENSRITIMALAAIILVGLSTYLNYPSAEDPTITIRSANVTTSLPGMSAIRVEELITIPLETAMRSIAEIKEITSTSKAGQSLIKLDLHDYVDDLEPVFQSIRNKAADTAPQLPEGVLGPVIDDEVGLTAIATVAVWSDGFSMAEMHDVAKDVRDRLYSLDGIRKVDLLGVQEERIYLEIETGKLAQFGVSPAEVFGALVAQNVIEPGGTIIGGSRSIPLEPTGNFGSLEEIAGLLFTVPGTNRVLRLDEMVEIRRDYVDPPQFPAYFNGEPAIVLSVSTVEGTNNIAFGDDLTHLLERIQNELPIGLVLDFATYQPVLIAEAVDSAVSNVYQTLVIVLVVVMLFLGVRTGLIVGSFVPLTMLVGIIVMSMFGVELQRMSIAAMIIALGLLVDNGIVVAEDIRVRMENGMAPNEAATSSAQSLAIPLLISSLTTVFAFLPMLLTEGNTGDYVRSLAQVVAILLLASWFLAMTVVPAICAWFMKVDARPGSSPKAEPTYDGAVYKMYRRLLELMLRWRLAVVGLMIAALYGSTLLLGTLKTEFFPLGDRNQLLIYLDFEAGTDLRTTQAELEKLTAFLNDKEVHPDIESHVGYVGFGGPRFFLALAPVDPDPHRAFVLINTVSVDDVGPVADRVNDYLRTEIPAANGDAKRMWFGSTEPGMLQIELIGPDGDLLLANAERLTKAFHAIPGTIGIKQDWENKVLNLVIDIDQTRARRANVTSQDVATSLRAAYTGLALSDYREGETIIPIVIRGNEDLRFSLSSLQRIEVFSSSSGEFVNLAQIADVRPEWRYSQIKRLDQQRTVTVEARHTSLSAPQLLAQIQPVLDDLDLPAGHGFELAGEIADQAEANANLFGLLPLAFAGIVILLVGQFNSFRKGGIILATIPLILIGGAIGLVIMGAPYGFMVLLGFFSLAGILINNGIVLIDRIQTEEQAGRQPLDAVITACLARLRPILMTTLTTVLGLIPLLLFGGALFYGMASVIAYGLVFGTIFTLGFVPVLYTLFFRIHIPSKAAS